MSNRSGHKKKEKAKDVIIWIITVICIIIAIIAGIKIYEYWRDYKAAKDLYDDTKDAVFVIQDDSDYDYFDFDKLLAINKYAIGWIRQCNDGKIDYPIVQYTDNSFYLTHGIDDSYSTYGTIFADYRITGHLNAHMCILWGHNMSGRELMFGSLDHYLTDSRYYEEYPTFTIWIGYEKYTYKAFACGYVDTTSTTFTYAFTGYYTLTDWLAERFDELTILGDASLDDFEDDDYVVTLATCPNNRDYSKRFVLLLYRMD